MHVDIHNSERKLESWLRKIKVSPSITQSNKDVLLRYLKDLSQKGLSIPRIENLMYHAWRFGELIRTDFLSAKRDDVEDMVQKMERIGWNERTLSDMKDDLKLFFKWLRQSEFYPEEVRWIRNRRPKGHTLPSEILTREEIKGLAEAAETPRDKALILVLYESGCRIGELLPLKRRQIQFDKYGAVLIVDGKTGMRRVRIVASAPALSSWLENHPLKKQDDYDVWIALNTRSKHKLMRYGSVCETLRNICRKAKINKRVNPHSFRHARATHLASLLTEAQMKEYFGWVQASEMASIYVHLSGREVDQALLKLHGFAVEEKSEEVLKPKLCQRCQETNDPAAEFCKRCGSPMDISKLVNLKDQQADKDEIVKQVLIELSKDENISRQIYKVINKLGLKEKLAAHALIQN